MNKTVATTILLAAAVLVPALAQAAIKTEVIEYKDGGNRFVGYLAYDDAIRNRRPGVLVVHEWWGLNDYARQRARDIAGLGYVALAADMYGDGKSTEDAKVAGAWAGAIRGTPLLRRNAQAALRVLARSKRVDNDHLAAIGFCFGGGTVLELAYSGAKLDGVVSFHGNLPMPTPREARNIRTSVLVLHGAEDPYVKPDELASFRKLMSDGGADWQLVEYGGVVHGYTNPRYKNSGMPGVAYDRRAENRAWRAMQDFLRERFSRQ